MVPVSGAEKDMGHDVYGLQMMISGCGDGRMGICRFPAEVALPDNNTGLTSGLCPLDETPWAPRGWGNMRRQQIAPSPVERRSLIYKYRS